MMGLFQPPTSNFNMLPETLTNQWQTLAEIVTAAVLVVVVFPGSQNLFRRSSQTTPAPAPSSSSPSFSTPDFAYAASAVLRPGETSTLRYGDESHQASVDSVPTMLRMFGDLSDSDSGSDTAETVSSASSSSQDVPLAHSVSTTNVQAGSSTAHGVRFTTPTVESVNSSADRSSPFPYVHPSFNTVRQSGRVSPPAVPGSAGSQFEPIVLPPPPPRPPIRPATKPLISLAPLRAASAPPSEPLPRISEETMDAYDVGSSASTAPKTKGKGKRKLQALASLSSAAFSTTTAPAAVQGRPTTRSMSAAPGPSATPPGPVSVSEIRMEIDEPPVDSYQRHETTRASWYESYSDVLIAHPPDFSSRGDVQLEDVFINKVNDSYQLWVWEMDGGKAVWKRVWLGYPRPSDGRKLTVTPTRKEPSWVSPGWSAKTAKKRAP